MLSAFGDESHDETKARVFAVAGLLGDDSQWSAFREKWKCRAGDLIFHAADCESGYGDFHDMPKTNCRNLHFDLTRILADSGLMGYGVAIDLVGCRDSMPTTMRDYPDMPYYDCFIKTILWLSLLAKTFVPSGRLEFTFDQNKSVQYNAGLLYDWISDYVPTIAEKISFGTRKEPGIQAADLWARELMKRCDSLLVSTGINPRPQWSSLIQTNRFKYTLYLGNQLARDIHMANTVIQETRLSDYEKWRNERKIPDNLSNRFRYFLMEDTKI